MAVEVLLEAEDIQLRVRELGAQISRDYSGSDLTLVGIMKGSIFFLSDLARAIDLPVAIELIGVASYKGGASSGEVRITHDVSSPMAGRNLLVVEDIIDTSLTMRFLVENLRARHPASLKICALLVKQTQAAATVPIDYKGFDIADLFVVGYGLDFEEKYRNLPYIGVLR